MSTPAKKPAPTKGSAAAARPAPTPMRHGGQPANGKHVPSNVPGHPGPFDTSTHVRAHFGTPDVGSNITCAPGADMDGGEVLAAPPWAAAYPTPGMDQAPMY